MANYNVFAHQSFRKQTMPDSPPSRPPLLRTDSPPSAPEPDSPSSAYRHGSRGAHAQGPEGDKNTHRSPRTPGPSPRSVIRLDASGLYHFPPKEPKQPSAPLRHHRRLSRANSGSQNSLISIDEENALTEAAVKKALQDQQQGPAWNNKRMCAALVCVAIWTYAVIYFAALYSYRLEALRLRRVIRGA